MNLVLLNVIFIVNVILESAGALQDISSPIQHLIGGGHSIKIDQAPYMAALLKNTLFCCGGSIISSQWILTACHCVQNIQLSEIEIRVGSSDRSNGGKLLNVSKIITHPDCDVENDETAYDCAVLKLFDKLNFDQNIQPINLPYQDEKIYAGTKCFVTGWGLTLNANESLEELRGVEVLIVDLQICKKQYEKAKLVRPENICAGDEENIKGACKLL